MPKPGGWPCWPNRPPPPGNIDFPSAVIKRLLTSCLLLCLSAPLWAQSLQPWLLAQAEGGGERRFRPERGEGDGPRLGRDERLERREARRQWLDSRQAERGGAPAGFAEGNGEDARHRLSPEERQRLRRDVHDAGREVYPREEMRPWQEEPRSFRSPRHP